MSKAHVTLVVDRSASMRSIKDEAEGGIRLFLKQQAAVDDVRVNVSLYQFDTDYEHVYGPVKVQDAPDYDLVPRANTALYDAIGLAIRDTEKVVAESKKKPKKIVVVVMTDGEENSSREHTFESVSALIRDKKAEGWQLVFLAGQLKSVQFGHASGLTTTAYDPRKAGQTQVVYATASTATANYLGGQTRGVEMPEHVDD